MPQNGEEVSIISFNIENFRFLTDDNQNKIISIVFKMKKKRKKKFFLFISLFLFFFLSFFLHDEVRRRRRRKKRAQLIIDKNRNFFYFIQSLGFSSSFFICFNCFQIQFVLLSLIINTFLFCFVPLLLAIIIRLY